jgi:predicted nucleic-acid-binding protein
LIAVDTNVLVRFLTQDDPVQSKAATGLFQEAENAGEKVRIDLLVLVEMLWVLGRAYAVPADRLREIVGKLLETRMLEVEQDALVREAVEIASKHRHDLPDVLIGLRNRACETTWTFDRKAAKLPGFRLLR